MTLEELLEHYPSKRQLAKDFHLTPQAITHWTRQGFIPFTAQIKIEHMSNGKFKADTYDKYSKRTCTKNYVHKPITRE